MRKQQRLHALTKAATAAISILALAPASYALIVGDFEGTGSGALDNWTPVNAFNIEPVQGIGNTRGNWALKVDVPQSFNQAILRSFAGADPQVVSDRQALMAATQFSIDVTTRPEDFGYNNTIPGESWIKFENLVINGPGIGYRQLPINEANAWNEMSEPAGSTTRHFTVSLGSIPWNLLTINPDSGSPDYLQMVIITQSSQNFDGLHYYFDNMQVNQVGTVLTWNVDASGNWSNGANWNPSTPGGPNDSSSVANFFAAITAPRTVTVNAARTVAGMNFNNQNTYTIGGTSMLTIAAAAGAANVDVSGGSHIISCPVTLGSDLNVSIAGGSTLTFSNTNFVGAGKNLLKQGGGNVEFKSLKIGNLTNVSQGVIITPGATANTPEGTVICTNLAISGNFPYVDLNNNSMIVDYTGGSPINAIRGYIIQGYNGGDWAPFGLTSTAANTPIASGPLAGKKAYLGYGDNATLGKSTYNGFTVDATSILVRWTIKGDATLDGQVDVSDLGALATNWQTSTNSWAAGDFNYDGFVDVTDLGDLATNWQAGVGSPLGPGSLEAAMAAVGLGGVSVPEPASLGLLLGVAYAVARPRRRSN